MVWKGICKGGEKGGLERDLWGRERRVVWKGIYKGGEKGGLERD